MFVAQGGALSDGFLFVLGLCRPAFSVLARQFTFRILLAFVISLLICFFAWVITLTKLPSENLIAISAVIFLGLCFVL